MKEDSQVSGLGSEADKIEQEESCSLTPDYTIKLQSSNQYGTGTKKEI